MKEFEQTVFQAILNYIARNGLIAISNKPLSQNTRILGDILPKDDTYTMQLLIKALQKQLDIYPPKAYLERTKTLGDLINVFYECASQQNIKQGTAQNPFQQVKLQKLHQEKIATSSTCDGCEKKCTLGAIQTGDYYYPTINGVQQTRYYDAEGDLHIIYSSTCEDKYAAFKLAKQRISPLCDFYNSKQK